MESYQKAERKMTLKKESHGIAKLLSLQLTPKVSWPYRHTMNPSNNFKSFKCKACEYFRKGLCHCVRRKDGPRATRDCRTCRCQIVNLVLGQKLRTHKMFYHLHNQHLCNCRLQCRLRSDGKHCQKEVKGKTTFRLHKTCQPYYSQCRQMQVLEKNYNDLCEIYKNLRKVEIPSDCTPFLGSERRNFEALKSFEQECFKRREKMAHKVKKTLDWKKPSKMHFDQENSDFKARVDAETRLTLDETAEIETEGSSVHSSANFCNLQNPGGSIHSNTATVKSPTRPVQATERQNEVDTRSTNSGESSAALLRGNLALRTDRTTQTTSEEEFSSSFSKIIQYYDLLNRQRNEVRLKFICMKNNKKYFF